jgi:pimeloyl-ACP methyl ester carboxylesterase
MGAGQWRDRVVRTPDGFELCVRDRGDRDGRPVIAHHGTPSCRLSVIGAEEERRELGIRLVTFDRPGYGRSSPRPGRRVADAAADVETIADALGLEEFSVCGWSGGGPHALACAALLPARVTRVVTIGSVAPGDDPAFDFVAGMPEASVIEFGAAMQGREKVAAVVEPHLGKEDVLGAWIEALPPSDRAVLERPGRAESEQEKLRESCRQGAAGWVDDDIAFVTSWGFALDAISLPVWLWQGTDDVLVPPSHARYLAEHIPGARLELVAGAGHWLDDHHRTMLAWLAGGDWESTDP